MDFLKSFYDTEGPLGLPMKDSQAISLQERLKGIPEPTFKRLVVEKAPTETLEGERSDVSWISTEDIDRDYEVVIAKGMDDSHFQMNPIVTLQHHYWQPPVGKSLWRKRSKDGNRVGIKAKTQYPQRPESWPAGVEWPSDCAFTLVQAGLLLGKSIGFIPLASHSPTDEEVKVNKWDKVRRVIDKWLLLEYACVFIPAQQNAIVQSVSKGDVKLSPDVRATLSSLFDLDEHTLYPRVHPPAPVPTTDPTPEPEPTPVLRSFTTWKEIENSIQRQINNIPFQQIAKECVETGWARLKGKV